MKRFSFLLLMLAACMVANAQRKACFDSDWKFQYGTMKAESPNFDDSRWRRIDLPHDWSVETEAASQAGDNVGPFSRKSIGRDATGHTVGGEGWYRKHFTLTDFDAQREQLGLYFEGAYYEAEVWLNGRRVGQNRYGYSSFRMDITQALRPSGQENVVAVRVRNEGKNTRWYSGSGLYRHVWLIRTPRLHVDPWDTSIRGDGELTITTIVYNDNAGQRQARLSADILAPDGRRVARAKAKTTVAGQGRQEVTLTARVKHPQHWSPETPRRYRLVLRAEDAQTGQVDRLEQSFGIRTLEFSAERGFLLNGQPTLLRGGCVHHDNGLLGAAAYDRAEDRKLQLLKNEGFNAVRCSHNLPSEHFLDACDSLGLMVIDECFDQWLVAKNPDDYHRHFDRYCEDDLAVMLRRDRNHPSVIMWSIGNEIPGRIEPSGMKAAERLRQTVLRYDTSRPVTAAICDWDNPGHPWEEEAERAFQSLDVGGMNYLFHHYEPDHERYPDRIMYGAESFPKRASENWKLVETHPYVIGDFVWTAMDYLGEAGIGSAGIQPEGKEQTFFQAWPWYNGWCGDIDLIGQKKPQSYYRDVVWGRKPVTMAVETPVPAGHHMSVSLWGWQLEQQSWTFPAIAEGTLLTVNVYSRAPRVRLYLNDELLGEQSTSETFWTAFRVPYRTGELRAVAVNDGQEAGEFRLQTTSRPTGLRLTADNQELRANGTDLSYVTIELVDAQGRVVTSDSERSISITVSGDGQLLASGNASPTDMESFRSPSPRLHQGRALAIVRSTRFAGQAVVTVSSAGLPTQTLILRTR